MRTVSCLCLQFLLIVASAAEGGSAIKPAPGYEPPPGQLSAQRLMPAPVQVSRVGMAYEVETLVLVPGDTAGLSAWAELAAHGFHLVGVSPQDGKQVMFFERLKALGGGEFRLPAAIRGNPSLADSLQGTLKQIITDRQQAQQAQPRPAPISVQESK